MTEIIPAILPKRFADIEAGVAAVAGVARTVQIDLVDGHFARNKTWWFNGLDKKVQEQLVREEVGLPEWQAIDFELDLMVDQPLRFMEQFLALGPSRVIFHHGSFEPSELQAYLENLPEITRTTVSFGVAIMKDEAMSSLDALVSHLACIQCMGIVRIGNQGEPFHQEVIDTVLKLKARYPEKRISVDGGVGRENVAPLVRAGADALVVGSQIWNATDPKEELRHLMALAETQNV